MRWRIALGHVPVSSEGEEHQQRDPGRNSRNISGFFLYIQHSFILLSLLHTMNRRKFMLLMGQGLSASQIVPQHFIRRTFDGPPLRDRIFDWINEGADTAYFELEYLGEILATPLAHITRDQAEFLHIYSTTMSPWNQCLAAERGLNELKPSLDDIRKITRTLFHHPEYIDCPTVEAHVERLSQRMHAIASSPPEEVKANIAEKIKEKMGLDQQLNALYEKTGIDPDVDTIYEQIRAYVRTLPDMAFMHHHLKGPVPHGYKPPSYDNTKGCER
jgi:hypothetical protein